MHAHRREGRIVSFALRRIERYQQSGIGASAGCRFRPSCSHYAEEALRTRRVPVAVLLIVWRLLRCNPFMHRRVADPVRRTRRWRLRPNTLPTMFSILALSGFIVVVTAGVAEAVGVTGGCQARLNGNDVSLYTSNHPLKVKKGGVVQFAGTVPSALIGTPKSQVTSNTHIEVEWITGIGGITSSNHPGSGFLWGGSQAVDNYLKYASGLYHVVGHVDGEPGSWKCDGDAYVWLDDGNPLTKRSAVGQLR